MDVRCPKCGSDMVLRTAKKGIHAGEKFYGCSRYPYCKEIVPFEALPSISEQPSKEEKPSSTGVFFPRTLLARRDSKITRFDSLKLPQYLKIC